MIRISVDRVYEAAVKQISGVSGPSGLSRLSGSSRLSRLSGADQIDRTDQTDKTDKTNQPNPLSGYTIFLDRDGTLNPDPGYIKSPDQFELFPGVAEALASLTRAGARLIVVTNQSGVARGLLSYDDLNAIHAKLTRLLENAGATLDAIYFCPHHPDDGCGCRKPNRGMIDQAVREWSVDIGRSYVIGDHVRDIELAKRVGTRSVLVTTGVVSSHEAERLKESEAAPDWVASSLAEAVDWLMADVERLSVPIRERQALHP
jgi:heptosyltransferase-2